MEPSLSPLPRLLILLSVLHHGLATENMVLVESWDVVSDIRVRFATTQIRSVVVNTDSDQDREALFHIVLPDEAFITNFTMEMNGEVNVGVVKEKEEAKADYEAAKRRGESAGLFRTKPRHTNKFDYSVNVHPLERVIFTLTYQEVLRRKFGRYEHVIHLLTDEDVGHMTVEVNIHESRELSLLDIPDLPNDLQVTPGESSLAVVERPTPSSARVHYEHNVQPGSPGNATTPPKFVVRYDVKRDFSAGEVLVVDGYFVHFFAPPSLPAIPKDIIFVLDVSGSMVGRKIEQLKRAMNRILDEMHEHDRFNIMTFHGSTDFWDYGGLVQADRAGKQKALQFVQNMRAQGMTNIHDALTRAVEFLLEHRHARHVPVIFFLTDGLPSAGTRDSSVIAQDVKVLNQGMAAIHGLAFGDSADYDLLKKVSSQNSGLARKIYEASDAALQVAGFYDEISTVTLDGLKIEYVNGTVDLDSLTQTDFKHFTNGSEVMVAGKLSHLSNLVDVLVSGMGANGEVNLVLEDDMIYTDINLPDDGEGGAVTDTSSLSSIAEKSWAFLTIKHLLNEKLKANGETEKKEIDARILELSLKYSFVTPLTSIVVTQGNKDAPLARNEDDLPVAAAGGASMMQTMPNYARSPGKATPVFSSTRATHRRRMPRPPSRQVGPVPAFYASVADPLPRKLAVKRGSSVSHARRTATPVNVLPTMTLPKVHPSVPALLHFSDDMRVWTSRSPSQATGLMMRRKKTGKKRRTKKPVKKRGKGKKNKRGPPPDCRFLGFSHLSRMNFSSRALPMTCSQEGPRKFPPGEIILYDRTDGSAISIVTTKGKRRINGLESLILSLSGNNVLIRLGAPNVTEEDIEPLPGYRLRKAGTILVLTAPDFEMRMTRQENQKGRRRCFKWVTYDVSIQHNGGDVKQGKGDKAMFPAACNSALSKKFLRSRRLPPQRATKVDPAHLFRELGGF